MEKFSKYWGLITAVGVVLIGIIGYIYNQGVKDKEVETRIFDSAEQKMESTSYHENLPSPEKLRELAIFDSLETNKTNKMLEQLINDSKDVKKHIHHLDSVNLLNATQNFLIKEELQALKKSRN